ncbi:MAG: hypothetical protein LBR92_03915 [Puniceicoccales bacterium]|jgi:hypothetical protein|nr:hypothetical protein [Puniceicoccales bacterium]
MFLLSHRVIKSVVFCTICLLSWRSAFVWAAAAPAIHLDFPAGAPGRCPGCVSCSQNPPGGGAGGPAQLFEHFTLQDLTGANADIYFPIDGRQPTTPNAAVWSCANVDANNLASPITQWYWDAFFTQNFGFAAGAAPQAPGQIMVLTGGTHTERTSFTGAFRTIAANPVGRVLLYRLIIEIRRQDAANRGCFEGGIIVNLTMLLMRNNARRIRVTFALNEVFCFICGGGTHISARINFNNPVNPVRIPIFRIQALMIDTFCNLRSLDIPLFHEMLHWFHCLRDHDRYRQEAARTLPSCYQYLSRCYYGDISELFAWCHLKHEEMRTILGAPRYDRQEELKLFHKEALLSVNPGGIGIPVGPRFLPPIARFYEGDDLSENTYRMARHAVAANPIRMRFGHGGSINPVACFPVRILPPKRFQLANLVARNCCNAIVTANGGQPINNWNLISGEAAQ